MTEKTIDGMQADQNRIDETTALLNARTQPPATVEPPKNKGGRPKGYSPKTGKIETAGSTSGSDLTDKWFALFASMLAGSGSISKTLISAIATQADLALEEYKVRKVK